METDQEFTDALKQFEQAKGSDAEQRSLAIQDMLFVNAEDGQWDEDAIEKRANRPRYTIDRVSPALDQIEGDQRQTSKGINVAPETNGTKEVAEILTGLIRSVEKQSHAQSVYDNAFSEAVQGGYGGWRITTDYGNDETFEQVIYIKSIRSAASSLFFDPNAVEYDKRDAEWAFLVSKMSLDSFEVKYPDASVTDFTTEQYAGNKTWFGAEGILIAEYWYKKKVKKKIGLLSDGQVIDLEEEKDVLDELAKSGITVKQEREIDSHKVYRRVMNGAEWLTEPEEWNGKFIPLVPMFGKTMQVEDAFFCRGIVRKAKDPQRIYNYSISSAIETTALSPKDPYWYDPLQAAGHEQKWKSFPTKNTPFLPFNSTPEILGGGPPQRTGAPALQEALVTQIQQAGMDIYATTGIEPASLGNVPHLKSGKAIQAEQAMGDRGSYIFQSNLEKSMQYTGEILVDLIPRIYDTERVVKILGEDDKAEDVTINAPARNKINMPIIDEQTGEQVIVNDLSLGSYSVTIKSGPSFATKRDETASQLITLTGGLQEDLKLLFADLIIDNLDLNKGVEAKKRIRKIMIDKGLTEPSEEEIKEYKLNQQRPDPMNQAMIENLKSQTEKNQVAIEKLISEIKNKDADTESKTIKAQKDSVEALEAIMKVLIEKQESGLPVTMDDLEVLRGQQAIVQEIQEDVLSGGELAGSAPLGKPGMIDPRQIQQAAIPGNTGRQPPIDQRALRNIQNG